MYQKHQLHMKFCLLCSSRFLATFLLHNLITNSQLLWIFQSRLLVGCVAIDGLIQGGLDMWIPFEVAGRNKRTYSAGSQFES